MNKLTHHSRQYRHNNKDGFVTAYEEAGTQALFSCLEIEIESLKSQLKGISDNLPELHEQGLGCGLEDRNITDRYEAAEYGFNECLEQVGLLVNHQGDSDEE